MKQAVIVTGGRTEPAFGEEYIKKIQPQLLIAVDSGMEFFYQSGIIPHRIVGDFDSVKEKTLEFFREKDGIDWVGLIPEKDDTDTEAAIRGAIESQCERIHLLGATGSRIDHVFANIHLLGMGFGKGVQIIMADTHNRIRLTEKGISIKKKEQFGDYVSLLPFAGEVEGLTLKGMKYPLKDYNYPCFSSLGISNEIVEEEAVISFKKGVLMVVESKDS